MNLTSEVKTKFLYVKVTGEFHLSELEYLVFNWIHKADRHNLKLALIDMTLVTGYDFQRIDAITIIRIGKLIGDLMPLNFTLAVLQTPQQIDKDRFFKNILLTRGINFKIATDMNEALYWLGVSSDHDTPFKLTLDSVHTKKAEPDKLKTPMIPALR
jgi:hypothetical protein